MHGLAVKQGFLQLSLMQVSLGGQSLSTRHSGCSDTTAEKGKHMHLSEPDSKAVPSTLTLYTRDIAITNQWVSASAGFSVIPGTTVCSSGTIAWSTKRLAFLLCESASWYKVTFLICGTVIVTGATCLNASN